MAPVSLQQDELPKMAPVSFYVPGCLNCFLLIQRLSKINECVFPSLLSNHCIYLGSQSIEILCEPFKNTVCIFHSPLVLLKVSPTSLQSQMFQGFSLPRVGPMGLGTRYGSWTPQFLGRTSAIVIMFIYVLPNWGWGGDQPHHNPWPKHLPFAMAHTLQSVLLSISEQIHLFPIAVSLTELLQ